MKKIILMVVAAMMATTNVKAQHEEGESIIQPRGGITLATLTDTDDSKMKVNITYGVEFEHFISDKFSLAGGILFTDQGTNIESKPSDTTLKLYYAAFPLTANYYLLPGLAVKAGVQPAYRVKARIEQDGEKIDLDNALELLFGNDVKMNKFDLSIPIGLSYEFKGFTLDARYNFGITKLFNDIDESVRNQVVTITLGYKL